MLPISSIELIKSAVEPKTGNQASINQLDFLLVKEGSIFTSFTASVPELYEQLFPNQQVSSTSCQGNQDTPSGENVFSNCVQIPGSWIREEFTYQEKI